MEQNIVTNNLYVNTIEPMSQGTAININSSSSSGQSINCYNPYMPNVLFFL